MKDINEHLITGRAGGDAEFKTLTNGTPVAVFNVASSADWKDDSGEWHKRTNWNRVVAFNKAAEFARDNVTKGARVLVRGSVESRDYEKDGRKQRITETVVNGFGNSGIELLKPGV